MAALLTISLAACGTHMPIAPTIAKPAGAPAGSGPAPGPTAPAPGSPSPGPAAPGGSADADPGAALSAADLLAACGGPSVAADADLVTEALSGLPVSSSASVAILGIPLNYDATTTGALKYEESLAQVAETLSFTATTATKLAQVAAQAAAAKGDGTLTATLLAPGERAALAETQGGWSGTRCSLTPATQIVAALAGGTVTATFAPPLPFAVSPAMAADTYTKELGAQGDAHAFGVTATVASSTVASLPAGTTLTGSVTVTPIAATYDVAVSGGASQEVAGDLAFEVQMSFGTPAQQAALGLPAAARYFLDTKNHKFTAVVINAGNGAQEDALLAQ